MVIVFDLDDTLYPEISFVKSGFNVVAHFLSPILNVPQKVVLEQLEQELQIQRQFVFDRILKKYAIYTPRLIARCLSIYRQHDPLISLYPAAKNCLERLKKFSLYVVTDGNKLVQKRKFDALSLDRWIVKCLCTYAYGIKNSKPSSYCFEKIAMWENVESSQVIYVGDNPYKDFVGIKPLGFLTVRVMTGAYQNTKVPVNYEADYTIKSLDEFDEKFLSNMQGDR